MIKDLDSFDARTSGPGEDVGREVAGLYAYMHLDVLIELARKVSLDFFARPEIYRDPAISDVTPDLARLHARYGYDEFFLSCRQRCVIFASVFGKVEADAGAGALIAPGPAARVAPVGVPIATDGARVAPEGAPAAAYGLDGMTHRFDPGRDQLLAATAAFSERVFDTGEAPLLDTVRVMAPGLKSYLSDLNNETVRWTRCEALRRLTEDTCYKILRNSGITRVFGLDPPGDAWPYQEQANGTTLVAEISRTLGGPERPLTRDGFIDRQRLALRGAEGVATVLDFNDGDDLTPMITACYTWYAARGRALGLPLDTIAVAPAAAGSPADGSPSNRSLFGVAPVSMAYPVGTPSEADPDAKALQPPEAARQRWP